MKVDEKQLFNLTALAAYLNENFAEIAKENGKASGFTVSDIQGYVTRGFLPSYLSEEGFRVNIVRDDSIKCTKMYRLKTVKD